jgi:hypothetical protein
MINRLKIQMPYQNETHEIELTDDPHGLAIVVPSFQLTVDITAPAINQIINSATVTATATIAGAPSPIVGAWLNATNGTQIPYNSSTHTGGTHVWSFTWNGVNNGNYLVTVQAQVPGDSAAQSVSFGVQHA